MPQEPVDASARPLQLTNRDLQSRGIPQLPSSAIIENRTSGGFFAGWLYVRARIPGKDFQRYLSAFTTKKEPIGTKKGEVRIIRSQGKHDFMQDDSEAEVLWQEVLEGTETWWTTHKIQDGFVFRWTDGEDGWRVYCDKKTNTVFIYWNHS